MTRQPALTQQGVAVAALAEESMGNALFSRRMIGFEQDSSSVTVHAEAANEIATYRGAFLLGCDGENSIVRKWLKTHFESFTWDEKFLCISTDLPLEDRIPDICRVNYMADQEEWLVLLQAPTAWRFLMPAAQNDADEWLLSDAKSASVFARLLGTDEHIPVAYRTIRDFIQAQTIRNEKAMEMAPGDAIGALENELAKIVADPARRREYMLRQSMVRSLEQEAAII